MGTGKRKVIVIVEGREYLVEVGDLDERPIRATVNQRSYQVQVGDEGEIPKAKAENGHKVSPTASSAPAISTPNAPAQVPSVPAPAPGPGGNRIVAPMPGDIIEIYVAQGENVDIDQSICVLEAMKMKNIIRSPQAGRIAQVHVQLGQAVAYGATLVTFE